MTNEKNKKEQTNEESYEEIPFYFEESEENNEWDFMEEESEEND